MKKRTLLLLLSLLPLSMTAQQKFLLRGQVVDAANDSPVSFATTALLRDSTAVAAVAAVRAAGGHVFLPVEGHGSVAAVAGPDGDAGFIDESICHNATSFI